MYDKDGNRVYPVNYNGTTYLPIRAIGTLLEQEVVWDASTQTVSLTRRTETPPAALTYDALALRTKTQEGRYTTLTSDITDTPKANTYAENLTIFNRLDGRRGEMVLNVRALLVDVSEAVRLGKLTESQRADLTSRLMSLDQKLTEMRATILTKYGVDMSNTATALRAQITQLQANLKTLEDEVQKAEKATDQSAWKTADTAARSSCKNFRDSLYAVQLALNDSLRRASITYAEYNALTADADKLDNAAKALGQRLDDAAAKWNGATKPDGDISDQDSEFYTAQIVALQKEADSLFSQCRDYFTSKNSDQKTGLSLQSQVDALERKVDNLEDAIEDSGKLSRQATWNLLRQLDKVDNTLDKADDFLDKADINEDDDDHDRGWHNGWNRDDD